jgi:SAM-dependent methyltransferase
MPRRTRPAFEYLLGDSRTEAARLRAQSRLWDPTALALFDRLGVRRGWRVLEVGPGQGSLHRELRRRIAGPADAVERSPTFAAQLQRACARDGFGNGQIWQTDLIDAPLPKNHYDLIFARWVFLFLPDPAAHVRKLVAALRPGGLLALEDYHRETFTLVPCPPEWRNFLTADLEFLASQGGDGNIGSRLPTIFTACGLDTIEVTPHVKTGHPGSPTWRWLTNYYLGVIDRYAAFPPFSPDQAARLRRHWLRVAGDRTSAIIAPAVFDLVGRKPRLRKTAKPATMRR